MQFQEIAKICFANRIRYNRGITKMDECNYPSNACYQLSREVLTLLEDALRIGFTQGFNCVEGFIVDLTNVAVDLMTARAPRNIPTHSKVVQLIKKHLSARASQKEEKSVMKNTIKQYVDSSLSAIQYLCDEKYKEEGSSERKVLKQSAEILEEIDKTVQNVFDDKSEDAVILVWEIYNSIMSWRNATATHMVSEDTLQDLRDALNYTKEWAKLTVRKKEAKTAPPVYKEDIITSFANVNKYLESYQLFNNHLNRVRNELEENNKKKREIQATINEYQQEIRVRENEKSELQILKKQKVRDFKNGDIDKEVLYHEATSIDAKMESLDKQIERLENRIESKKENLKSWEGTTDVRSDLIERFSDIAEMAEMYKTNEPVFVEISRNIDFSTMVRVLQGIASPQERRQVADSRLNMEYILELVKQQYVNMEATIKKDMQDAKAKLHQQEKQKNQKAQKDQDAQKKAQDDYLNALLSEDEDEVAEENAKAKPTADSPLDEEDDY